MFEPLTDLSTCRILLSNDDGINAPGLKHLEDVARQLSDDVWVVAPETEQSGAGHSLTLHRPLRIREISEKRYAVDGTPTDAVMLAVNKIMRDHKPDVVLSGINRGGNLGEDVTYSGTVAAAMEGTLMGIRAFALSQVMAHPHPTKWSTATHFAPEVIRKVLALGFSRNTLININFPDVVKESVEGVEIARQGKRKIGDDLVEREDPRGRPYIWIGGQREEDRYAEGTDLERVLRGRVTVTPLCVDLTDHQSLERLKGAFR